MTTSALTRARARAKLKAQDGDNIGLIGESGLMDARTGVMKAMVTTAQGQNAVVHIPTIADSVRPILSLSQRSRPCRVAMATSSLRGECACSALSGAVYNCCA